MKIVLMTFKDLKKKITSSGNQQQQQTPSFDKLQNKPFWISRRRAQCRRYPELLYEALLSPDFCNPLNHDFKDKHL